MSNKELEAKILKAQRAFEQLLLGLFKGEDAERARKAYEKLEALRDMLEDKKAGKD